MTPRMTRQTVRVYGWSSGTAETRAPTPAELPTATTRTESMTRAAAANNPERTPRFSFATVYDPPPVGYAAIVCRYDRYTTNKRPTMRSVTGPMYPTPAAPRTRRTVRAASGP